MIRTLLAIFRPLYTIAKELTALRELKEMEMRDRMVDPRWIERPLVRITDKPKKGDVQVTYQGDIGPRWKDIDWLEGDQEDFPNDESTA